MPKELRSSHNERQALGGRISSASDRGSDPLRQQAQHTFSGLLELGLFQEHVFLDADSTQPVVEGCLPCDFDQS